jgi:hypothetical protein
MTAGPRLQTVVADTSALVSLAVPRADATVDDALPDPLQYVLTSCTVSLPPTVQSELSTMADYDDIHGAAASNVLAADSHYTVVDPYDREETPDERPEFGLDDGETDGIVLANSLDVDGFLTDEFGGTNFALIHAALRGPQIVPTPRLIRDYARGGHMSTSEAQQLLDCIGARRSWGASPYVALVRDQLES